MAARICLPVGLRQSRACGATACPSSVVLVAATLYHAGAENVLAAVARHLVREGVRVHVVGFGGTTEFCGGLEADGAKVHIFPRRWRFDPSPSRRIAGLVRRERPAAVLSFGLFEHSFVRAALLGSSLKPRTIVAVHGSWRPERSWRVRAWMYARFVSPRDRVICVCDAQLREWLPYLRIRATQCRVIYNGVDVSVFDPRSLSDVACAMRASLTGGAPEKVIVQVGRFAPCKAHEDSLEALAILRDEYPDIVARLVFVGDGQSDRVVGLRQLAIRLGVANRVTFTGLQGKVGPYYGAADVVTLSSHTEALPLTLLEGMAMGRPVVATAVGGIPELVVVGKTGILVPPREPQRLAAAWASVLANPTSFSSSAIRHHAKTRFSIQRCVASYACALGLERVPVE